MHLTQARSIAYNLVDLLKPHCSIINVAGSIRREVREVKDIEIVCLPCLMESSQTLFGEVEGTTRTNDFAHTVMSTAKQIIKGSTEGKYMQIMLHQGIVLDLFMPSAPDYYRQLAIRTGSAEYAQVVIAAGWRKIGWCGSDKGLRKIADCVAIKDEDGRHKAWKCTNPRADHPPHWQSEEEFFNWINVPWRTPKYREIGSKIFNEAL